MQYKITYLLAVFLLTAMALVFGNPPPAVRAAYNDAIFSANTPIRIDSLGIDLTVVSGSVVENFTVTSSSVSFDMKSGSVVTVRSAGRNILGNNLGSDSCSTAGSEVTLTSTQTETLTLTPTSATCTIPNPGGGGSGGGGSGYVPPAQTVVTTTTTSITTSTPAVITVTPAVPATPAVLKALPYAQPKTIVEMQTNLKVLLENLAALQAVQKVAAAAPAVTASSATVPPAGSYKVGLTTGSKGNNVTALQNFLKSQGPDVYPEGLVTGYYGNLTKAAVGKFQMKNGIVTSSSDPGYGYVGPKTRAKINGILGL